MTITPIGDLVHQELPPNGDRRLVQLTDGRHKVDKGDWVSFDGSFFVIEHVDISQKMIDPPIVRMTLTLEPK